MLSLQHEVYTKAEILDALHGKHGSRSLDFRFDLLDKEDRKIGDVSHLIQAGSSSIDMDNQAEIHRTAKFTMRDDGSVNFLSDRIQPWAVLKMPAIRRSEVVYEEITGENLLKNQSRDWVEVVRPVGDWFFQQGSDFKVEVGQTYTFSIIVEKVSDDKVPINLHLGLGTLAGNYTWDFTEWRRNSIPIGVKITLTYTVKESDGGAGGAKYFAWRLRNERLATTIRYKEVKLEKGGKSTPWSPAPADIGIAEYQEKWMRKTIQPKIIPSQSIEFPLGVFLLSTPEKSYQNRNIYRSIEAYDKLQILLDAGFTARYVADEGELVTDVIDDIIRSTGITQINIERSDVRLPTWFSWDPDVSRLEVVNQLLQAINYEKIYVDEYGYFTSRPYRTPAIRSAEYEYKTDAWSVITPGATALQDFFAVPNQWVGVISEPDRVPLTYTYENQNPDSPTSIPARGRSVTKFIDVDAADIESLQGIVQKQAFEDSQVFTEMTFQTAIMPFHSHSDVYRLQHNILGVDAKFQELSWSMTLAAGATMSHTAREIIDI